MKKDMKQEEFNDWIYNGFQKEPKKPKRKKQKSLMIG